MFRSILLTLQSKRQINLLFGQTIWVESKEHADKYYTTMEQSVLYEYKIIE